MPKPTSTPWKSGYCSAGNHHRCLAQHSANPARKISLCICSCHDKKTPATEPPADDATVLQIVDAINTEGALADAVHTVLYATSNLNNTARTATIQALDPQAALHLLNDLRTAMLTIRRIDDAISQHVYLTAEHGKQIVDGIGEVYIGRARSKTVWNNEAAARAVIDAHLEERGYEVPDDPWDVAEWLLEAAAINYFRKTALKGLGIDPRTLYEDEPGNVTITLPSAASRT